MSDLLACKEASRSETQYSRANNLEMLGEKAKENGVSSKFIFTGFVKHENVPKYISRGR